jgi:hypothetical protein
MPASAQSLEDELIKDIAGFDCDPAGFVRYAYPWGESGELAEFQGDRDWQFELLDVIGKHLRSPDRFTPLLVAVASGHGIGKSALVGQVISWGMSTCEDCRVQVSANTGDQLKTKTIPEVSKWFRLLINAHWWNVGVEAIKSRDVAHDKTWRCDFETWSLERTEAIAGLHNKGKRIIRVFDEASAIPDKIWEVAEGALTDEDTEIIWLVFGNPTLNTGRFRECFGKNKHRWITRQIDSRTVEGTNKAQLDKWVQDYGEDSDFVRVRVRGEFPRAGSAQFIGGDVVAAARKRTAGDQGKAYRILSVDVARFGDDQTVIGYRQGLRAETLQKVRKMDTMFIGGLVCEWIKKLEPRACVIDGDGIGGAVVDYVNLHLRDWIEKRKEWFKLVEFHGAGTPGDTAMYFNKRAEVWGRMRDWLETAQIPDDPEFETDLTGPEYFFSAKNQIQLERKEDMKKRGLASPDCGDMLAMTFATEPVKKTRDEALAEQISAVQEKDPTEAHFMRLRETERRQQAKRPLQFWE